jgi:hypothetical protein
MITESDPLIYNLNDLCRISVGKYLLEIEVHARKLDARQVEMIINKLNELAHGNEYLLLVNVAQNASVTLSGLKKLTTIKAMSYAVAKAYVINAAHQRVPAQIVRALFRPEKPVKFFQDRNHAQRWLEELVMR